MNPNKLSEKVKAIADTAVRNHILNGKGYVIKHYLADNRVDVSTEHPNTGKIILRSIPVRCNPGMHASRIRVGTMVYLNYIGGDIKSPIVVSIADEKNRFITRVNQRHTRKGALIPDCIVDRSEY